MSEFLIKLSFYKNGKLKRVVFKGSRMVDWRLARATIKDGEFVVGGVSAEVLEHKVILLDIESQGRSVDDITQDELDTAVRGSMVPNATAYHIADHKSVFEKAGCYFYSVGVVYLRHETRD